MLKLKVKAPIAAALLAFAMVLSAAGAQAADTAKNVILMISDGQPEQSGQLYTAECAKNVILMISDGQGYNTIKATDYFNGSAAMYESFPVQFGVSTYSAGLPGAPPPPAMIPYWHGASRNI